MLSGERKEGGSPRFGKLHLPVGLWINSPRKQLAKLGRRWPSAVSVKSSSSDTGSRSSEPLPPPPPHVELRRVGAVKAAGGASGSRAKRISQLFRGSGTTGSGGTGAPGTPGAAQRWASEKKLPELAAGVAPEPPLAARATAPPGVLKIFGAGLASGANYKSVLATARSTARELVAEALERYGLAGSPGSGPGESSCVDAFALCDALGRPAAGAMGSGEWRAEHLRVLGDSERPLLVQELWRARPGWARRFELRGREEARRLEQEAFGAADGDGTGAPSWRPQKNRSRAASGGAALASPGPGSGSGPSAGSGGKERSENLSLRRSVSELSLQGRRRRQQERRQQALSMAPGAADAQIGPVDPGDFDQLTQCLIQAPSNRPYFLLLQGYQDAQEKIKEIGDRQPENHPEGVPEVPLTPEAVSVELRPLMLWMANTTELLSFVQEKVLEMEKEADQEDPQLCNDLELCDEAMALLDEVIMCTFQQSVYYLTKTLYSTLPALLDSNPFTAGAELPGPGAELGAMPPGLRPTLGVFQAALELTSQCELHPDLVSQTFGYLFFFSNASLLNSLMERGQGRPFYQWSRAVQIRTNLDLVLDWLQGAGLGDIATEFFRKLSIAVNLLCVPRTSLLKASWSSLRTDHPTLTPAQLHHLLSHYQLGPGRGPPPAWDPPPAERDAVDTGDIFESFSSHPPLILPLGSSRLSLTGPVTDDTLHRELRRLRRLLWDLEQQELPANHRHGPPVATPP
ncbi:ras-interacting protein 1 isoform X2 [Physeter macrocephalus]|uniref:Ras-interacting protein 1 isoform X2 n=1 Tax=Physeter macrocephalus TaxID=9755 RepID=A0A9W2WGJ2_PHYMC|nr:ras-interacting protein 1 isoform X2 [Physeter catodon]